MFIRKYKIQRFTNLWRKCTAGRLGVNQEKPETERKEGWKEEKERRKDRWKGD